MQNHFSEKRKELGWTQICKVRGIDISTLEQKPNWWECSKHRTEKKLLSRSKLLSISLRYSNRQRKLLVFLHSLFCCFFSLVFVVYFYSFHRELTDFQQCNQGRRNYCESVKKVDRENTPCTKQILHQHCWYLLELAQCLTTDATVMQLLPLMQWESKWRSSSSAFP